MTNTQNIGDIFISTKQTFVIPKGFHTFVSFEIPDMRIIGWYWQQSYNDIGRLHLNVNLGAYPGYFTEQYDASGIYWVQNGWVDAYASMSLLDVDSLRQIQISGFPYTIRHLDIEQEILDEVYILGEVMLITTGNRGFTNLYTLQSSGSLYAQAAFESAIPISGFSNIFIHLRYKI